MCRISKKKRRPSVLALTQELIEIVRQAALPIPPPARRRFYEAVDRKLDGHELGPGAVARACIEAQRAFLVAPQADVDARRPTPPPRPPPRSPWRRRA